MPRVTRTPLILLRALAHEQVILLQGRDRDGSGPALAVLDLILPPGQMGSAVPAAWTQFHETAAHKAWLQATLMDLASCEPPVCMHCLQCLWCPCPGSTSWSWHAQHTAGVANLCRYANKRTAQSIYARWLLAAHQAIVPEQASQQHDMVPSMQISCCRSANKCTDRIARTAT